jgi:hypothetical protein
MERRWPMQQTIRLLCVEKILTTLKGSLNVKNAAKLKHSEWRLAYF